MILLWGHAQDGPLALVRDALEERGAPVFFLDQQRAGETEFAIEVDATVNGNIRIAGEVCALHDVAAVYVRCESGGRPAADQDDELWRHAVTVDELMMTWLAITDARVINPFAATASNGSKPYQSMLIAGSGFAVPETLVTTDVAAVRAFWDKHGEIIYKSTSAVRSIVSRLTKDHAERLEDIRWCPTQFQQYVPGRDVRVHVVGDEIFATEIHSEADDYRYGERQGIATELRAFALPNDCAERCHKLAHALQLPVAGIDLRRTPRGEWYCFEVNPSPAFSYYEAATHQPIAEAIAGLLMASERSRPG
ncbi:conserved hypothetical protein; putative glutathione synthase [Bradyrhizobium sp. ORS 278]|uniref:ATP-grasp domain-containing protein n=1 Tax=Bradyrhizobium sp. (strain ORS 278) TaxID=114615 RepID=UPI000150814E|nr:glutathione synthase [Bradyrhizobium sp. ORS 278]CAL78116.1 conserved hypothetical protein; putative glutathione synthase [Bradyrhizobium sp. ORS 278]